MKTYKIILHRKGCGVQVRVRCNTDCSVIAATDAATTAALLSSSDDTRSVLRGTVRSSAFNPREGRRPQAA